MFPKGMSQPPQPRRKRKPKKLVAAENLKPMKLGGKQARGMKKMSTMLNSGRTAKTRGMPY